MDGGLSETPFIPQLLLERSIRHERVSDVGERAMTLNCHIVGQLERVAIEGAVVIVHALGSGRGSEHTASTARPSWKR
jgi:hypothetical protein